MSKKKHNGNREAVFPPIVITSDEARRLSALANSSMALFPRVAHFLADETERAKLVADDSDLRGMCAWARWYVIATTRTVTSGMSCWFIRMKPISH